MNSAKALVGALLVGILAATLASAANELLAFDSDELRERYRQLTFELRCPKCPNQNIADSNAPISEDMRQKTYELLHQGYSNQQIIDFMVARYSEFVIYKPQFSALTLWLWLAPGLLLLAGLALLWRLTRKRPRAATTLSESEQARVAQLLNNKA